MKFIILALFFSFTAAHAECNYAQMLKAEEFPIGVMLSWSTSTENNNSMFIVEKSENNVDFTTAGTVKGAGTSSNIRKYNFLDAQASVQKMYYRLKQIDTSGAFNYTEILAINKKLQTCVMLVQLNSEMVTKSFDMTLDALKDGGIILQLLDGAGTIAWQGTRMLTAGLNNISIDMTAQRDGVYKVVVIMERDEKTLTIRKAVDEAERRANVASQRKTKGKQ